MGKGLRWLAAWAALTMGAGPCLAEAVPADKVAVQLYSLHTDLERDPAGTLARIRSMGLTQVEAYGTLGLSPQDFRALLDRAGVTAVGSHVWIGDLKDNLPKIIETARIVGYRYVGAAWLKPPGTPDDRGIGPAEIDTAIATYASACPALKAAGLRVIYHIHGYEFAADGTGTLLDRLLAGLDPDCVDLQMDVFWVVKAGVDPVALLRKLGPRVKLLHLKDMRPGAATGEMTGHAPPDDFAALGRGVTDWTALLTAARAAGVDWYVLEDESPDAADHLAASLAWLKGRPGP